MLKMMDCDRKQKLAWAIGLSLVLGETALTVPGYANAALDTIRGQTLTKTDWQIGKPTYITDSTITADSVSFKDQTCLSDNTGAGGNTDWQNYTNQAAPFQLDHNTSLTANQGLEIANLQVGQQSQYATLANAAFALTGASLATPTLEIHDIASAEGNTNPYFTGFYTASNVEDTYTDGKYIDNTLRADTIHIHDISTDSAQKLIGANMGAIDWKPFTAGATNNLLIENISDTVDHDVLNVEKGVETGTLVYGLANNLIGSNSLTDPQDIYDVPFTVSGTTTIRNINATHGSAIGEIATWATGSDHKNNTIRFHELNISDIHGSDMSIGLYGGVAKISVENANINMTGKNNEYAGLYTASVPDFKTDTVKEFAVAGPFLGNIYMDDAEGKYTINGNILADQANHALYLKDYYDLMKASSEESLNQPGLTDEDKEMMRQQIQEQLQPYEQAMEKEKEHPVGTINLGGHLSLYGDIYAKNGGTVNLQLTKGSTFEGQADSYTDFDAAGSLTPRKVDIKSSLDNTSLGKQNNWEYQADIMYQQAGVPRLTEGTINITMDPGSTWITRGKSFITNLDFNGGGLVDTRKGHGVSVNMEKLTGNGGTFLMDFSQDHAKSDMLYIKDISGAGTQNIEGFLLPGTQANNLKGLRFATTGGDDYKRGTDKFTVSLFPGQGVNNVKLVVKNEKFDPDATAINESFNGGKDGTGTYKPGNDYITAVFSGKSYTHKVPDMDKVAKAISSGETYMDDKGEFLPEYMKDETIDNPVKEGTNWYVDALVSTPSDSAKVIKKSSQLAYTNTIYGITTDTLEKRMGEARYSEPGDGMWGRVRYDGLGRTNLYRANDTMTELGYDWKRKEGTDGKQIQGAAVDYMNGKGEFRGITGSNESKRLGLWFYNTWLGNKGHYTDLVAKAGRLSNKFDLYQPGLPKDHGDYRNNYYSLSFEYGRKKELGHQWYVEPQAQVQYTRLSGADYTTSQGSRVRLDGVDSFIGRAGFRLGRELDDKNTLYVNGNVYHEFAGSQGMHASDLTGDMDVTGYNRATWYELGLGLSSKVGHNAYAHMSFDRQFGNGIEHSYSLQAGVDWKF